MTDRHHYPWLDWLRSLAALIVLLTHVRSTLLVEYGGLPASQKTVFVAVLFALTRLGNEAVIVFFVLSGFFVAGKGSSRLLRRTFSIPDYLTDRITRIYVPYIPALCLSGLCAVTTNDNLKLQDWFANLFGLQGIFSQPFAGNGALWSLSYEIWFYILLAAFAGFTLYRHSRPWMMGASIILLLSGAIAFTYLSTTYLLCWLIGGFSYWCQPKQFRLHIFAISLIIIISGIFGIEVRFGSGSVDIAGWNSFIPPMPVNQLLLATGVGALIPQLALLTPRSNLSKKIEGWGSIAASFSYTLYLTHVPILNVVHKYLVPKQREFSIASVGAIVATCCLCLFAAWLLYLPFEKQTWRVRRAAQNFISPQR